MKLTVGTFHKHQSSPNFSLSDDFTREPVIGLAAKVRLIGFRELVGYL